MRRSVASLLRSADGHGWTSLLGRRAAPRSALSTRRRHHPNTLAPHPRAASASASAPTAATAAPKPHQTPIDTTDDPSALASFPPERVRNFSIIAHVDHGKSTLSDRLIELTGALRAGVSSTKPAATTSTPQMLDSLAVERSRGITIKAQTVSLLHTDAATNTSYLLNLIDTPGHVDFSYEVSRSLAACQGALLLVDATKGVQAQTVANFWLAYEQELTVTAAINKVDLPHANVEGTLEQMGAIFDIEAADTLAISAKTGSGVPALLSALIARTPPPPASAAAPLRVLLFDSWYDDYRGVLSLVQVLDGELRPDTELLSAASGTVYTVGSIEMMRPLGAVPLPSLGAGMVGCVALGFKSIAEACVGDTLSSPSSPAPPLPGFKRPQPMVFAGVYPPDGASFDALSQAMRRFLLKDGSVTLESEHSPSLGRGYRCGFLGLLHMEVVQQRLEEEHNVTVVLTSPTVPLRAVLKTGAELSINSPEALPDASALRELYEPLVRATILTPSEYMGALIGLCEASSGADSATSYIGADRVMLQYTLPLAEIATDFHDRVKSISSGYASLDYEPAGEQPADVVVLGLRVNDHPVSALTRIVRRPRAVALGRHMVTTIKEEMERESFDIIIQATQGVGPKPTVLARETIKAVRKNVLSKCYGGDVSRKRKLIEKQKAGRLRQRSMNVGGDVNIPHAAFVKVLSPGGS